MIDLIIEILRGSKNIKEAKDCLVNGNTENIRFKTEQSERMPRSFILQSARLRQSWRCVCTA